MASSRRLQIAIDDERYQRISAAARERGVSVATIVREAIDLGLRDAVARREAAGRRVLGAPDMAVPEPSELRALRDRRSLS